jgi:hypothetical protein
MSDAQEKVGGKSSFAVTAARFALALPILAASGCIWIYCVSIYDWLAGLQESIIGAYGLKLTMMLTILICCSPLVLLVPLMALGRQLFQGSAVFASGPSALAQGLPTREDEGAACPSCHRAPPCGKLWKCHKCWLRFDTFEHQAVCPGCGISFPTTACPYCRAKNPIASWYERKPDIQA